MNLCTKEKERKEKKDEWILMARGPYEHAMPEKNKKKEEKK